ncbi:MAG: DUF2019 domain-containing protein [Pseudolabrys sp.]
MKSLLLKDMTVPQLIEQFTSLALGQFKAELYGEIKKYNRMYDEIVAIRQELKNRANDQRTALVPLFTHTNPQVRLMAAQSALAVAPAAAQQTLQALSDRNIYPQAAYARGTLMALERGDRKPT